MRFGSLFSGVGGMDLGLERAGMECAWQAEVEPYCCEVLAKHWPDVPNLGDVTEIVWEDVERVDLICGGFPCQPVSIAGRRLGEDDERWLWPEFLRAVRMVRPRLVLLENVPGLFTAGFGGVAADLAASGYDLEWDCVPAAAVGAPHLRDRLFAVAWLRSELGRTVADSDDGGPLDAVRAGRDATRDGGTHVAHSDRERWNWGAGQLGSPGWTEPTDSRDAMADTQGERRGGRIFSRENLVEYRSQSAHRDEGAGRDGEWWAVEPAVGRVAHGIPRRVDRLRALGNAVVPQVAQWIGERIMAAA